VTVSRDVTAPPASAPPDPAEELTVVPAWHPWRWVATAVVAPLLAMAINALVTNPAWDWPTEERKDKYDFATYRVDTVSFEVQEDSQIQRIAEPRDVAGLTISVGSGTNQEEVLVRWDEQNRAAGLPSVNFQYYENPGDYYLALDSGRIDVRLGPNPTAAYHVAVGGTTKIVGSISGGGDVPAEIAAMTRKDNGLVTALNEALNTVITNEKYAEVLARWHLTSEAIEESEINPPGLPRKPAS
jgi:polar amino acid transport system substrate-binding protein